MMDRLIQALEEVGQVESRPKQEGPNLSAMIAPKKVGTKGAKPAAQAGGGTSGPKSQERAKHGVPSAAAGAQPSAPVHHAAVAATGESGVRGDTKSTPNPEAAAEPKPVTSES
jgi:hypothetical protein